MGDYGDWKNTKGKFVKKESKEKTAYESLLKYDTNNFAILDASGQSGSNDKSYHFVSSAHVYKTTNKPDKSEKILIETSHSGDGSWSGNKLEIDCKTKKVTIVYDGGSHYHEHNFVSPRITDAAKRAVDELMKSSVTVEAAKKLADTLDKFDTYARDGEMTEIETQAVLKGLNAVNSAARAPSSGHQKAKKDSHHR